MKLFITENGSVLGFDPTTGIFYVLVPPKTTLHEFSWARINCNSVFSYNPESAFVRTTLSEEAYLTKVVNDARYPELENIQLSNQGFGRLMLRNNASVQFCELSQLDRLPEKYKQGETSLSSLSYNLRLLFSNSNFEDRAIAALNVKQAYESHYKTSQDTEVGAFARKLLGKNEPKNVEIDDLNKLTQYAKGELKRLRFAFFAANKRTAIQNAIHKIELGIGLNDEKEVIQKSHKLIARESGLIDALSMHRFLCSSKARNHQATDAMARLEAACPGISSRI